MDPFLSCDKNVHGHGNVDHPLWEVGPQLLHCFVYSIFLLVLPQISIKHIIMKRAIFVLLIGIFGLNLAYSQELWFDAGLKGGWGPTFLYNQSLVNDANYSQQISNGYTVGGKFGFNFGYIHGITFDAMYAQNKQFYNIKESVSTEDLTVNWKTIDLYVLYRLYRTINYFEITLILWSE